MHICMPYSQPTLDSPVTAMAVDSLFHVAFVVIVVFSSLVDGTRDPTCEPITGASACTENGITLTYLPNDFGETTVSAAATALSSNFDNATLSDSCSSDLGLFACLLYFPDCRLNNAAGENVVRRPCRDFCERVQAACVNLTAIQNVSCDAFSAWDPASPTACYDPFHLVVINEVNADNPGTDISEYVELWDYGMGSTPLGQFVVLLVDDVPLEVYDSVDLTGAETHPNGYYIIGRSANGDFTPDAAISSLRNAAKAVSLHRGSTADFPIGLAVTPDFAEKNLVDALVYHTTDTISSDLGILYPGQDSVSLSESSSQFGSISRCISFRPLISLAYLFVLPTPGARNNCSQSHLQLKITVQGESLYNCCADASVIFCAFNINNLNPDDGYCKSRTYSLNVQSSGLNTFSLETASCSPSIEALVAVQPFLKQNILMESCSIASVERERATLICSTPISSDECEVFLVSSLINNSTSELDVSALCDGENVIGFTVGFDCSGTNEFPCLSKQPWKFVARPASLVSISVVCTRPLVCQDLVAISENTATLDSPNDSDTYVFVVTPLPGSSSFDLSDEFTAELFYNDDVKATIDVPVLISSAGSYRAFSVVPAEGVYRIVDEFVSS
ncbi:uncharacterized protein [Oscarella lobularis]|uniref:uncharacterized protein isoform X2 n=1 Tax=Oscarella lobularis TaxID=121494 RepID=UPI0033139E83